MNKWQADIGYHVPKLTLLEVWPLNVFIGGRQNLTVVDVGANVGLWCQAFMNTFGCETRKYIAVEPLSGNLEIFDNRLRDGLIKNQSAVTVERCCAGPKNGGVDVRHHRNVSALASVVLQTVTVGGKQVDNSLITHVRQQTLDTLALDQNIEDIDVLKIDVEGYEWDVLCGADGLLKDEKISMIYFEFGEHQGTMGQSFKQFWSLLTKHGFDIYRQSVGRNFFGLQRITKYHSSLEDFSSMWMILASRIPLDDRRNTPFVIGTYRPKA